MKASCDLSNYEQVKPLLAIRMCDPDERPEYQDAVYTRGSLDVSYRIDMKEDEKWTCSLVITNQMLDAWGITKEQLHKDALEADAKKGKAHLSCVEDEMACFIAGAQVPNLLKGGLSISDKKCGMYVLTNQAQRYGASVMAHDGVLEEVGEVLGAGYYILPVSVHGLIIVADNEWMDPAGLQCMVKEVNETEVNPEEFLSNKVFYCDREDGIVRVVLHGR